MSLRLRLTVVFALTTAVVLAAMAAFLHVRLAAQLLASIDRNLGTYADTLLADTGIPSLASSGRFVDPDEAFAQLLRPSGQVIESSPGLRPTPLLTASQALAVSEGHSTYLTERVDVRDPENRHGDPDHFSDRLLSTPTIVQGEPAVLVVGQTLSDRDEALARQLHLIAVALPVALLVMTTVGWLVAAAALRPVEAIRRRAAELSAQDRGGRLPVPKTGDELARLTVTLNQLLDHLHQTMEREHRFVDDASHELRTPLAVLKAELDLALARPRRPEELHTALVAAAGHTDELVRLAEDLLVLARTRGGLLPLHRLPTDLRTLLDRAVDPLRPAAAAAGRELSVEAPDLQAALDPVRVRQAVLNLVDNALRHGRGTVTVTATTQPTGVTIEVRDQGEGFPPELSAKAFEPFVRGLQNPPCGKGAGLGLAIVQAVAAAHGGRAETLPAPRGGACVQVHLPVA